MSSIKIKGRGAQSNIKNRFERLHIELDDSQLENEIESERKVPTIFFKDESKSIIARNDSEDLFFNYSINPYRGCEHGCIYCYARPSHEYLGFSAGLDFESKIMIKEKAPELLKKEFEKKSFKPDVLMISGNTDCYQPIERTLKLTRALLKVCLDYRNPVAIITKNSLVERDLDVLSGLKEFDLTSVMISITSLDEQLVRKMEPRTSTPSKRLRTIETLSKQKIPVGVMVAPIIPGLTDEEIPAILKAASEHGASFASKIMLRLPYSVKDMFIDWLKREYPDRAKKVINRIKEIRGGKLNQSEPVIRFTGEGTFAESINNLFKISSRQYGLEKSKINLSTDHFRRKAGNQLNMFGE